MEENNKIVTVVELSTQQALTELTKMNSVASNSTKTLEERIKAKNKTIEIQNELSKRTIQVLENERRTLEGMGASEKELQAIFEKLNKAKLESIKISERNSISLDRLVASQEKQNQALADAKNPIKNLDNATGGLLEKFKLFFTNPLGIAITALVTLFNLFKEAINRNAGATEAFNKIISKFTGFLNGTLAVLGKVAEFFLNKLSKAIDNPKKAFEDLGKAILENLVNRIKSFLVIGQAVVDFFKGNFRKSLQGVTDGIIQMGTGVTNASSKLEKLGKSAVNTYSKAASATERLANATRQLEKNQVLLEQSDLRSKKLAEDQRQIRDDTSRSIKERIAANNKLGSILDEQLKRELKLAKQTLKIEYDKRAAYGTTQETIEGINAARTKILEIEERIGGQRSEQLVNTNSLLKEQSDNANKAAEDRKKRIEEETKAETERQEKLYQAQRQALEASIRIDEERVVARKRNNEDTLAEELDNLEQRRKFETSERELTQIEIAAINAKYSNAEAELTKQDELRKTEKKNKAIQDQIIYDELLLEQKKKSDTLTLEQSETNLQQELSIIQRKRDFELSNKELTEQEKLNIIERANQKEIEIQKKHDDDIAASKKSLNDQILGGLAETFGIQKEVAVAQMIIAAPEAIGNSFKNAAKVYPFPLSTAMGALGAAATVAPIVKGLKDIKKVRFPGRSKGGSSSSSGGSISSTSGSTGVSKVSVGDISANNAAQLGIDPSIKGSATAQAANSVLGGTSRNVVFSEGKYSDFKNQVEFKESKTTI